MVVGIGEIIAGLTRVAASPRGVLRIFAGALARVPTFLGKVLTGFVPASSLVVSGAARLLRAAFVTSKVGLFAIPLIAVGFIAIAAVANPYLRADLDYAHERSSAIQIFDVEDRWLGIIPPAN